MAVPNTEGPPALSTLSTAEGREIAAARALCAIHIATVFIGLALGGPYLIFAGFGAAMAAFIAYFALYRPAARARDRLGNGSAPGAETMAASRG